MSPPVRWIYWVLGACAITLLTWWLATLVCDHGETRRIYLDAANGLQVGDGVYAGGQRVGSVRRIRPYGRRIAVDLRLKCRSATSLNLYTTFFLDRDPDIPGHLCLRALSHGSPELKSQAKS